MMTTGLEVGANAVNALSILLAARKFFIGTSAVGWWRCPLHSIFGFLRTTIIPGANRFPYHLAINFF
jgi:hypothetical protein